MLRIILWLPLAALAFGQGTEPKPAASAYPVHQGPLGAEFMVHSYSYQGEMYFTQDYLVVEVALFPVKDEALKVNASHFTLRLNGKRDVLHAQNAGLVAASLKHPDWHSGPRFEAGAGVGNAGVTLGPPRTSRFPDDPEGRSRLPNPPRAPEQESAGGAQKKTRVTPEEAVTAAALPEGDARRAVSGYLYFAWTGKTKSLRKVELLWHDVVLKLE